MEFILTPASPLNYDDCGICYEPKNKWTLLPCTHRLCSLCVIKLVKNTCPWCRETFPPQSQPSPKQERRPRSLSDPVVSRNDLTTPEEVINYEREVNRRILTRARIRENRKKEKRTPWRSDNNRDILSRQRDPVTHARNQALSSTFRIN